MVQRPSHLPDYATPPVVEVIFAVSLPPLPLSVVDLAQFGVEKLGDECPVRSEQPPMQMPIEAFDGGFQMVAPTLALLAGPPPVRLWFQSVNKDRLVQLQRDWFACNWQGMTGASSYPRYENIESSFLSTWDSYSQFISDRGLGDVTPIQCELSYINHILPSELWQRHGQISKVIRLAGESSEGLPEPEDGQVFYRYRIPLDGQDVGRLYVQATPAFRQEDRTQVIQLNMVARGAPLGPGRDGMIEFFRLARQWIVNGFSATTTDAAQTTMWGKV